MTELAHFEAVGKRYGNAAVVDDLTLTVPEGAVIGLLGPNGAGKTTSIRMLLGLAAPTAGEVRLLGAAPGSAGFAGALRQTGALIEGPALYARATARDNLRIEMAARRLPDDAGRVAQLLELVGLADRADSAVGNFSLGMKQRLGLALALCGGPRLAVLDEPTNGLDPAGIVEIRELIKRLPERGTTVLVSSHLLAEVQLMCHRAAIIHRGRLIAEGTIDDLLRSHGVQGFAVAVADGATAAAAELLRADGLTIEEHGNGRLLITGEIQDGSIISRRLAAHDIHVRELVPRAASLEEVFLSLTDAADPAEG